MPSSPGAVTMRRSASGERMTRCVAASAVADAAAVVGLDRHGQVVAEDLLDHRLPASWQPPAVSGCSHGRVRSAVSVFDAAERRLSALVSRGV